MYVLCISHNVDSASLSWFIVAFCFVGKLFYGREVVSKCIVVKKKYIYTEAKMVCTLKQLMVEYNVQHLFFFYWSCCNFLLTASKTAHVNPDSHRIWSAAGKAFVYCSIHNTQWTILSLSRHAKLHAHIISSCISIKCYSFTFAEVCLSVVPGIPIWYEVILLFWA